MTLEAGAHVDPKLEMPAWLDGREGGPPIDEIVAFRNGMLHLPTGKLLLPDARFFSSAALPFDYTPATKTPRPKAWLSFLAQIFEGEYAKEQIDTLQEILGYLITGDVSLEKAFLLLGPKRSGKGTILAVIRALLAPDAVVGPSLKSLGDTFGLQPLIGRQLAIIDDLRVGSRTNQELMAENILKIVGRGYFTLNRKFKTPWNGSLPIKLVVTSNNMPVLNDDSAAVASRFIILETRISFFGKEDPNLLRDKLLPERMGILHWALAGLRRLRKRGHFAEPEVSRQARERLAKLGSPVLAFVKECCVYEPNAHVSKDEIFATWTEWANFNREPCGSKTQFCEALYAACVGYVRPAKLRIDGERVPSIVGLRMSDRPQAM